MLTPYQTAMARRDGILPPDNQSSRPATAKLEYRDVKRYVLAGKAIVTLFNPETNVRFTYKVTERNHGEIFFVGLMTDTDTYQYFGFIRGGQFYHGGHKAKVGELNKAVQGFIWFYKHINDPQPLEVWHEGKCGRCERTLTDPESIQRGIGPECAKHFNWE